MAAHLKNPIQVKILWTNPNEDWNYFEILAKEEDMYCLRGIDDRDNGDKHNGDIFIAYFDEMKKIRCI